MLLELLRPDAVNALDSLNVKLALPNYKKILLGKSKPKFQIHDLDKKLKVAYEILKSCELCERKCHINRLKGEKGFCKVGKKLIISSAFVHLGEEPMIIPSFTIFFMGCTFQCQYCQNYTISQWQENGKFITEKELAELIDKHSNCRTVNLVGGEPTPQLPFILNALKHVKSPIPVVWNSNFYMSLKSMDLLKNVVDIYLSDWKYGNDKCAEILSKTPNYWGIIKRNHDLAFNDSEMIIRHLILPNHFDCCTKPILEYISENYSRKVILNLMDQYYPSWEAHQYPEINRRPKEEEIEKAYKLAEELNLNWIK